MRSRLLVALAPVSALPALVFGWGATMIFIASGFKIAVELFVIPLSTTLGTFGCLGLVGASLEWVYRSTRRKRICALMVICGYVALLIVAFGMIYSFVFDASSRPLDPRIIIVLSLLAGNLAWPTVAGIAALRSLRAVNA